MILQGIPIGKSDSSSFVLLRLYYVAKSLPQILRMLGGWGAPTEPTLCRGGGVGARRISGHGWPDMRDFEPEAKADREKIKVKVSI